MKITPEAVVARYRELGVRPRTTDLGVYLDPDGEWRLLPGDRGCCALGVMLVGCRGPWNYPSRAVPELLDVDYESFYFGFDGLAIGSFEEDRGGFRRGDYELGKACREATIAAGLWTRQETA